MLTCSPRKSWNFILIPCRISIITSRISFPEGDLNLNKTIAEGMEKGRAEGKEEGIAEGMSQRSLEIARKMLAMNIDEATILKLTGLSLEEIRKLKS